MYIVPWSNVYFRHHQYDFLLTRQNLWPNEAIFLTAFWFISRTRGSPLVCLLVEYWFKHVHFKISIRERLGNRFRCTFISIGRIWSSNILCSLCVEKDNGDHWTWVMSDNDCVKQTPRCQHVTLQCPRVTDGVIGLTGRQHLATIPHTARVGLAWNTCNVFTKHCRKSNKLTKYISEHDEIMMNCFYYLFIIAVICKV